MAKFIVWIGILICIISIIRFFISPILLKKYNEKGINLGKKVDNKDLLVLLCNLKFAKFKGARLGSEENLEVKIGDETFRVNTNEDIEGNTIVRFSVDVLPSLEKLKKIDISATNQCVMLYEAFEKEILQKTNRKPVDCIKAIYIGIAVIFIAVLLSNDVDAIADVKNMSYEELGNETFGEAAKNNLEKVKWESEKIEDDEYKVTLNAFSPELYSKFSMVFVVTYSNNKVYMVPEYVIINEERFTDEEAIWTVLGLVYGMTLDEASDSYWGQVWNGIWEDIW